MNIEETINNIVDRILNEELSKKMEEAVDAVSEDMGKMSEERDEFDRRDSKVVGVDSDIKKQRMEEEMDEEEMEEGNAFSAARAEAIEKGEDSFEVDGKTYPVEGEEDEVNESKKNVITLSESEMIELIQRLVMEQKEAKGMKDTEKVLKDSKKVNDEAMKDVNKKMKDYVKAGSNEGYEENPEGFPKGNGEMGEDLSMKYHASDAVEEFIEFISRTAGQEDIGYDQIKPDEDWLEMNIMGSTRTGNSQEYANAVPTDVNKKINIKRKKQELNKLKDMAYNKAPQPVYDFSGNKTHNDSFAGLQTASIDEKKGEKINEDIHRMKSLLGHDYKTQ
jgi:hypothetical protein